MYVCAAHAPASTLCVPCKCGAHREQKRAADPLELELRAVRSPMTWVLGPFTGVPKEDQCGAILYRPHIPALYQQPGFQGTVAAEVLKASSAWLFPELG